MTSRSKMKDAALEYAEMGFPVFPCMPGTKVPLTETGFLAATTDESVIERWWSEHPAANIAMATEGLIVIDIDPLESGRNPWPGDPNRTLDLSSAPMSLTPRGGCHYLFRQPEGRHYRNTASSIAPKVDTRANGGYIVLPPSRTHDGTYRWSETLELESGPKALPVPPGWLLAMLRDESPVSEVMRDGNPIPSGARNNTLARLAGGMRRMGMEQGEILSGLRAVNARRCNPPLPEREVEAIAESITRYEPDQITVAVVEGHFAQMMEIEPSTELVADPGPLPPSLLRVPGFVSEVMDYCLETAPYPNPAMAFCGALTLQAALAGRKVRDPGDNRTNLYLLGLAHSSAGKDRPRKVNIEILSTIGADEIVGGQFASGEGVQDALQVQPTMLFQTDEIDGMLQSISKSRDARYESIMNTLLTMYSSANSVFPIRKRAGKENGGIINQPCLVVLGTAIPNHYYEALSERMLTNGFFARMMIVECGKRGKGQEPRILPIPKRVLETAKAWRDFIPGGNLANQNPVPAVVPHSEDAAKLLVENRLHAEAEYAKSEAADDPIGTTVWGRVSEHTRKLALLYAISENQRMPAIGVKAVEWAGKVVFHQARRMLSMVSSHVSDNPFHAECLKLLQKLMKAPDGTLHHSVALKRMKIDSKTFLTVVETLHQSGQIQIIEDRSNGRVKRSYKILANPDFTPGGES